MREEFTVHTCQRHEIETIQGTPTNEQEKRRPSQMPPPLAPTKDLNRRITKKRKREREMSNKRMKRCSN